MCARRQEVAGQPVIANDPWHLQQRHQADEHGDLRELAARATRDEIERGDERWEQEQVRPELRHDA